MKNDCVDHFTNHEYNILLIGYNGFNVIRWNIGNGWVNPSKSWRNCKVERQHNFIVINGIIHDFHIGFSNLFLIVFTYVGVNAIWEERNYVKDETYWWNLRPNLDPYPRLNFKVYNYFTQLIGFFL